jgi:hypothetical protein
MKLMVPKGGLIELIPFSALAREKQKDWRFIHPSVFH